MKGQTVPEKNTDSCYCISLHQGLVTLSIVNRICPTTLTLFIYIRVGIYDNIDLIGFVYLTSVSS